MRGLVVSAVLALAGCDQVFDLSRPAVDAAPPDEDGDGILIADDNCPKVANPLQEDADQDGRGDVCDLCPQLAEVTEHDEDGDRIGDRCDSCPHLVTQTQDNDDEDQLGNDCDLEPQETNCIVLFDPFVTMPAAGEVARGTWSIVDDTLVQTDPEIENAVFVFDTQLLNNPMIQTSARVVELSSATNANYRLGVWGVVIPGTAGASTRGIASQLAASVSMPVTQLQTMFVSAGGTGVGSLRIEPLVPATPLAVGSRGTLRLNVPGLNSYSVFGAIGQALNSFGDPTASTLPAGRPGLRTGALHAAFEYVLIVDRASACAAR